MAYAGNEITDIVIDELDYADLELRELLAQEARRHEKTNRLAAGYGMGAEKLIEFLFQYLPDWSGVADSVEKTDHANAIDAPKWKW